MAINNHNYGKIVDGKLIYAPNRLETTVVNEQGEETQMQTYNAPADVYAAQGWLPIIKHEPPAPDEGGYYTPTHTEVDNEIVQAWEYVPYEEVAVDD